MSGEIVISEALKIRTCQCGKQIKPGTKHLRFEYKINTGYQVTQNICNACLNKLNKKRSV